MKHNANAVGIHPLKQTLNQCEIPDEIPFEALLGGFFAADFGQARDGALLQATMQGRAAQMRDGRLKRVQAIVQRQQRAAAKRGRSPPRLRC